MARFGIEQADNYGGQGGGGFFSLKNDHDTARVRFLYNSIDDVEGFAVHQVEIDGKKRWVNCLREYGEPVDACPMCKSGSFTTVKYFVPLYNVDTGAIVVWERGKKFGAKLSSLCSRYPNLVSHIFEIERVGAKGDTNTTYEIYEVGSDDTTLEDFEIPNPLGTVVLDKTPEELEEFLDTGSFDSAPVQRRGGRDTGDRGRRREAF